MLTKSFETNELLSYCTIHSLLILEKAESISEIEDVFVDVIVTNSSGGHGWSILFHNESRLYHSGSDEWLELFLHRGVPD